MSETTKRLQDAPLGTKARAIGGGHWVKVERGWKWHNGDTFPTPGADWDGTLTPPTPESDAHREVRKSVVCEKCYGLTSCWCPPTPDRAAVREALVGVFTHFPYTPELMLAAHRLVHALGIPVDSEAERIADALLAAVSRPAEAAPVAHPTEAMYKAARAVVDKRHHADYPVPLAELLEAALRVTPLYAAPRPAPSGGEAVAEYWCVMFGDNEDTGDLFAFKEDAHAHARELDAKYPDTAHVVVRLVAPSLEGVRPLRPAPLPADVQAAVEKIRLNLDNEATYRHACSSGIAPLYLEHADGNQGFICSESDLRILLAHLTREA